MVSDAIISQIWLWEKNKIEASILKYFIFCNTIWNFLESAIKAQIPIALLLTVRLVLHWVLHHLKEQSCKAFNHFHMVRTVVQKKRNRCGKKITFHFILIETFKKGNLIVSNDSGMPRRSSFHSLSLILSLRNCLT